MHNDEFLVARTQDENGLPASGSSPILPRYEYNLQLLDKSYEEMGEVSKNVCEVHKMMTAMQIIHRMKGKVDLEEGAKHTLHAIPKFIFDLGVPPIKNSSGICVRETLGWGISATEGSSYWKVITSTGVVDVYVCE